MKNKVCLIITILFFNVASAFGQELTKVDSFKTRSIAERVNSHNFPAIAEPWGKCIDFANQSRLDEIAHHDIYWEGIGKESNDPKKRASGPMWKGEYPALGETFLNLPELLERRKELLKRNPNIILLGELRWRDYTDPSLPADHPYWKRDTQGNRVPATGDKMAQPRYYLDTDNPELIDHLCRQAKYMVESGVYDGVFLDWFGPSAAFFKKLRETIGDKYLIITNANYKYDAERAKYINGAYMECYKVDLPEYLPLWEATVRSPKINVVDMMGEQVGCVGEPDLKRMRNTTTYALVHSDGYVLYGDHYHNHRWFSFWDTKLGAPKSDEQLITRGAYKREFENGVVVNNSSGGSVKVEFKKEMKRVSDNKTGTSFKIDTDDGDFFVAIAK